MTIEALEHYTIYCADLERSRDFYTRVIGLPQGARPNLPFPGYWMYCGDVAVVHLVGTGAHRGGAATNAGNADARVTGPLDHVALKAVDFDATCAHFRDHGVTFREGAFPDLGLRQIFVHDPDGIMLELNFSATSN